MRVFLSWSGERSGQIAQSLKVWLTDVMHLLQPWVSSEDIDKGARWSLQLAQGLQDTSVGIICLTPENLTAPWILFEAGALAKYVESSRVCTYLFHVRPADIDGPLASFQATEANKTDTLRLIRMLNGLLGEQARPDEQLRRAFEKWWPEFEAVLDRFQKIAPANPVQRSDRDLLEEILSAVRLQERASANLNSAWPREISGFQEFLNVDADEVTPLIKKLDLAYKGGRNTSLPTGSEEIAVDGLWVGEWTGGPLEPRTSRGVAKITSTQEFLVVLENDDRPPVGPYLLVARKRKNGFFVGRYVNLRAPLDSTAWVGVAVSNERIEGLWRVGRWDFSREYRDH
jgi:hypothetical protein